MNKIVLLFFCITISLALADFDITPNVDIRRQPSSIDSNLFISSYQALVGGQCSSNNPDADLTVSMVVGIEFPLTGDCKRIYFSSASVKQENRNGFANADVRVGETEDIGCNEEACVQKFTVDFNNTPCSMFLESELNPTVTIKGDLAGDYCYGNDPMQIQLSDFAIVQVSFETEPDHTLRRISTSEVRLRQPLVRVLYGNPYLDANDLGNMGDVDGLVGNNGETSSFSNTTTNDTFVYEGFDYTDRGGASTFSYTSDIFDWFSDEGKEFIDNKPYMKHWLSQSVVTDHSVTDFFTEDEAVIVSRVEQIQCCVLNTTTLDPSAVGYVAPDFSLYPTFGYPVSTTACLLMPNSRCSFPRDKSDDDDEGVPEDVECYDECPEGKRYTQYCTPQCALFPTVYNFTGDVFLVSQWNISVADVYAFTPGYATASGRMPMNGVSFWTVFMAIVQFGWLIVFGLAVSSSLIVPAELVAGRKKR